MYYTKSESCESSMSEGRKEDEEETAAEQFAPLMKRSMAPFRPLRDTKVRRAHDITWHHVERPM